MRAYKGPIFRHRHYATLAKVLADARAEIAAKEPGDKLAELLDGVSYVQDFLRDAFKADNSRFDRERFDAAASGRPLNGKDER